MLILAGVTIAALSGDNGILQNAARAKEESEKAEIIEQIRLDITDKQIENEGSINENEFYEILRRYGTISSDKTILTTTKGSYGILISDIYNGTLKNENIDYKINVSSDTIDLNWENNILSFSENSNTQNCNIVWINENEIEFSRVGGTDRIFVISGDNEHYVGVNLEESSFLQLREGNLSGNSNHGSFTFSDLPEKPTSYSRIKFIKNSDGDIEIKLFEQNVWIDYYTVDIDVLSESQYYSGPVNFGFLVCSKQYSANNNCDKVKYIIYNEEMQKTDLYGKNIAFLGDSITNTNLTNYTQKVSAFLGANQYCYGKGGAPIGGNSEYSFVNRFTNVNSDYYVEVDKNADIIFIFGGHNDSENIGNIDDSTSDTLYGSLRILIEYFNQNYPNSKLIFGTPIKRDNEDVNQTTLKNVTEAIKNICELYDVAVIDLYNNSGITSQNANLYLEDGVHPNEAGNKLIADYIITELRQIY